MNSVPSSHYSNSKSILGDAFPKTGDFTAQDGDVLEKTINSDYTITIPDGATVTLQGAGINDESKVTNGTHASITCLGDATIILDGNSTVRSFGSSYPAIKPGGSDSSAR